MRGSWRLNAAANVASDTGMQRGIAEEALLREDSKGVAASFSVKESSRESSAAYQHNQITQTFLT